MLRVTGCDEKVTNNYVAGTAGGAITITLAADAEVFHAFRGLEWSYESTPAAGSYVQIAYAGVVVWKMFITSGGPGWFQWPWKEGLNNARTVNQECVVTLSAPGGSIDSTLTAFSM
jgi:hypothetical protein